MKEEIVQLTAADFDDAMDFLNLVFGAHRPHDFANLLPAIYQPDDAWMACNYAIREHGRIRAVVGMFPIYWQVGKATFKVAGVGGVSTHPKSRGAGYMRRLMEHCVGQMRQEGCHLSYLGGQRQRYQYFGYERCGLVNIFSLNRSNLRHGFGAPSETDFAPLERKDAARLSRVREWHDRQLAHCRRAPDNFYNHLRNWHNQPYAALAADGRLTGYLVAAGNGERVAELVAEDDVTALQILRDWTASRGDTTIELPGWRVGLTRRLGQHCESASIRPSGNWQIFDWAGVLDGLLKLRQCSGTLLPGSVTVAIQGYGTVELRVEGERAGCAETGESPQVQVDPLTAMRLFFGPLPPSHVMALPASALPLEQWCPLPLSWPSQDGV